MIKKIFAKISRHKIATSFIIIILGAAAYYGYIALWGTTTETSYVLASVQKGTIIVSVSGSGQISASDQVDIKPKVSGDVIWVGIKAGQEVKQGQTIFSLNDTDAKKEIASAELAIEEAQLNLDKSTAQAPIDYESKLESLETAKDNLKKEYEDIFSTVSNAFLSLPTITTYGQNVLYGTELSTNSVSQFNVDVYRDLFRTTADKDLVGSFADIAVKDYKTARDAYNNNFLQFKNLTLYSSESEKEEMLNNTLNTTRAIAQSIKSEINLLDTIVDIAKQRSQNLSSTITGFQTNLRSYLTTANNNLSTLLSQQSSLKTMKAIITSTENTISILKINNPTGVNPIDLQISRNNIEQKKVALADLKANLADYVIYAPFAGIITEVNIKKGDSVSSGTVLTTLITRQKIAEISLNEIDAAKVKVGQKVTLTFDAVGDLSITGEVAEIDTLGTVSQGVVTYAVKIVFDTQDERIKSGMSVSATIITEVRQDVLLVPNAAVKSNGEQYVEVMENNVPHSQTVEIGLSNDTTTEIKSGIKEGENVVTQTTTANSTAQTQTQNQGFRMLGIGGMR